MKQLAIFFALSLLLVVHMRAVDAEGQPIIALQEDDGNAVEEVPRDAEHAVDDDDDDDDIQEDERNVENAVDDDDIDGDDTEKIDVNQRGKVRFKISFCNNCQTNTKFLKRGPYLGGRHYNDCWVSARIVLRSTSCKFNRTPCLAYKKWAKDGKCLTVTKSTRILAWCRQRFNRPLQKPVRRRALIHIQACGCRYRKR